MNSANIEKGFCAFDVFILDKESRNGSLATKRATSREFRIQWPVGTREHSKSQKCSLKSRFASSTGPWPIDDSTAFCIARAYNDAHTTTCTGTTRRIPRSLNAFHFQPVVCRVDRYSLRGKADRVKRPRPGKPWTVHKLQWNRCQSCNERKVHEERVFRRVEG